MVGFYALGLAIGLAVALLLPSLVMGYKAGLKDRHQACLESIARMEPELFPDLPNELAWVEGKRNPGKRSCG
jgi:hypothetical protein